MWLVYLFIYLFIIALCYVGCICDQYNQVPKAKMLDNGEYICIP